MSDSVGKITLDLEVTSDIAGQVNKISSIIANTLKSNLNNKHSPFVFGTINTHDLVLRFINRENTFFYWDAGIAQFIHNASNLRYIETNRNK